MKKRILIIGLEPSEAENIRTSLGFNYLVVHHDSVPAIKLQAGMLLVESPSVPGKYLDVDGVILHGIYENDFDVITMLALWGGPCLPGAVGMMDMRQRIPALARALKVTRYNTMKRGMAIAGDTIEAENNAVAKWGIWHCGEDKARFTGEYTPPETAVVEEFIEGNTVRVMIVGKQHWQIQLTGEGWLKSIHGEGAAAMAENPDLIADAQNIANHFGLQAVGIDYMISNEGQPHLLEVNHIPNITVFPFMTEAFIELAKEWAEMI